MRELDIIIIDLMLIADKLKSSWFSFLIPARVFIKLESATKDLKSANINITNGNIWDKNEIKRLKSLLSTDKNVNTLTNEAVISIFKSVGPAKDVAKLYNISGSTVSRIRNRKTYTEITKDLTR